MRKLFFLHVVFSYSICVAVGAYIGSTLNNNTPTSGPNPATAYQQPKCLNSHPLCCQQPNYETSNGQNCPNLLCTLPLCKNNTNYSGGPNYPSPTGVIPLPGEFEKKEAPINPDIVGNIKNEHGYNWKERNSHRYNKCFPRFETKYKEKCEKYEETNCRTKHEEKCDTVTFQNCALVPKENHERKCENVNEQICHLKKTYENEEVVDYVPKQKCHKTTKRLCDTIWQFDHGTKDEYLCKEITKPKCRDEWKTLFDETCKTTYRFDCRVPTPGSGYGDWMINSLQQVHRYQTGNHPYNNMEMEAEKMRNKHLENFKCRKIPNKRCYKTPRKVKIQKCEEEKERKCQKVTNHDPRPTQQQSCHDEPYEECEIEKQHQTKMIQVPKFTEECENVPRELCDNRGTTTLEVKCVDESKPICEWEQSAEPECSKTPREHCYQVPYQEKTTDCDESYQENLGGYHGGYGGPSYHR